MLTTQCLLRNKLTICLSFNQQTKENEHAQIQFSLFTTPTPQTFIIHIWRHIGGAWEWIHPPMGDSLMLGVIASFPQCPIVLKGGKH